MTHHPGTVYNVYTSVMFTVETRFEIIEMNERVVLLESFAAVGGGVNRIYLLPTGRIGVRWTSSYENIYGLHELLR